MHVLVRQKDEETGRVALVSVLKKCGKLEILPVKYWHNDMRSDNG